MYKLSWGLVDEIIVVKMSNTSHMMNCNLL
jgi:hypothetical protein